MLQDRYVNFRSSPALADATAALVHAIAAQSCVLLRWHERQRLLADVTNPFAQVRAAS
jgi:hypothetical protein